MAAGQRHSASATVARDATGKSALVQYSLQVYFQERGDVGRIVATLKGAELTTDKQRQQAQKAELIGRGENDPASRPHDARELPDKSSRILDVFDSLH